MEKKFNYVYITINLINDHKYIGDRSCNCEPEQDKYLGSGTYYINAEQLYGKQNFKKQILEFFPTKKEAFNAQEKYIKKYNTLVPNGYNISPKGGHQCKDSISDETRKNMSESQKGRKHSKGTIEKIRKSKTGQKHTEKTKEKCRISSTGRHPTKDSRNKMSNSKKGKVFSFIHKKHLSESLTGKKQSKETIEKRISKTRGLKRSEEFKQNMKKPKSEEHKQNISNALKGHIVKKETRDKLSKALTGKKRSEEYLQKRRGRKASEETKQKQSKALRGKKRSAEARENMRKGWIKRKKNKNK